VAEAEDPLPQHEIGYGRPPRDTQFKKGRSGNPKGRPKGSLNFSTLIEKELKAKITVNENGVRKRITKKHAIAKQLVNRAATGDHKAIPTLISEERSNHADSLTGSALLPADDQRVLDNLITRIRSAGTMDATNDPAKPLASSVPSIGTDMAPKVAS
jgi:hypothetical protein